MWLLTYRAAAPFSLAPGLCLHRMRCRHDTVPLTPPTSETGLLWSYHKRKL
ncbi:hypothetical protein I79_012219 [Cricetulus griseus]|uniref:Uncharacterized protein n=1 Tax=Cricetulus griseus TaxID=10029 RepID=G3HN84_CRIGR|nr:hypothetical protein I79_012219 [Cricetulus griseus]